MKRCAPPLSVISYQVSGREGLQRESRSNGAVINPSGLRTRAKVSRGSRMRGAIGPNRTGITREGTCVPAGENFFDLEQARRQKCQRSLEGQFYEEITFICHRDRSLRSDHRMPNDVNWCEYSVSEGDATRTSRVQMEDGSYAQTAGTRKRIA